MNGDKKQFLRIILCRQKWRITMPKNPSIHCDVTNCKYNMDSDRFCTLDSIKVGTHEANPTVPECTDCMSFIKK